MQAPMADSQEGLSRVRGRTRHGPDRRLSRSGPGRFSGLALCHDADGAGVIDGGRARVASAAGELTVLVEITDEVAPGTVSLPHGWGHGVAGTRGAVAATTGGVNSNVLTTDDVIDPLSGNARLNAIPVTVSPLG